MAKINDTKERKPKNKTNPNENLSNKSKKKRMDTKEKNNKINSKLKTYYGITPIPKDE